MKVLIIWWEKEKIYEPIALDMRSKHLDKRLDVSAIANYKDGYWDGFDSRDDESGDGNHDDVMLVWC